MQTARNQCERSFQREKGGARLEGIGVVKGGQFGLSLGRLLSKGGMMRPVARVARPCWSAAHDRPHRRDRGVDHDGRNPRTKPGKPVTC
jgi:hypothetical protein